MHLLSSRRTIEILDVVGREARAVIEIAEALGDDLGRTWRHVRRLENAGILAVQSERKRGGRSQKLYVPMASEFVVTDVARHQTVSRELSLALMESIERHDTPVAERFFFDGMRWRVEKVYGDATPTGNKQHELWMVAKLDAKQRDALTAEIEAIFSKYGDAQKSGSEQFLVRFACALYERN